MNGEPIGEAPEDGVLVATFPSIQTHVLTPMCTACHAGATAPQGLRLDAASSYDLLVGVPSSEAPSLLRVAPGQPAQSYLIHKLRGSAAVGERMPLGQAPLPEATIAVIEQWITDGAQRGDAGMSALPETQNLQLVVSAPADGDWLGPQTGATRAPLLLAFDRALDASLVNDRTVSLRRIEGAADVEVPVVLATPLSNPRAIHITPRTPLAPGDYRLTLHGDQGVALAGLDGGPLAYDVATDRAANVKLHFTVGEVP